MFMLESTKAFWCHSSQLVDVLVMDGISLDDDWSLILFNGFLCEVDSMIDHK